ncbi:hypothetical protein H4R34_002924 [Dimargaris verticillata]|uniref:Rap-GAP domain-containing protein n=1 Tax=Dimargaris verticillata TaxID=2761393 RepID=A0A9W8E9I8_9FUNG|nr:hypothetical protein H4R34_002924 [Dimargaris verticillata]
MDFFAKVRPKVLGRKKKKEPETSTHESPQSVTPETTVEPTLSKQSNESQRSTASAQTTGGIGFARHAKTASQITFSKIPGVGLKSKKNQIQNISLPFDVTSTDQENRALASPLTPPSDPKGTQGEPTTPSQPTPNADEANTSQGTLTPVTSSMTISHHRGESSTGFPSASSHIITGTHTQPFVYSKHANRSSWDRNEKGNRKIRFIFDDRQKPSLRFSHLVHFLENADQTEKSWFYQIHADTVFTIIFDHAVELLHRLHRKSDLPTSPEAKEIVAYLKPISVLQGMFYYVPLRIRAGWNDDRIAWLLSSLLDPLNHHHIRRIGLGLLLEWMNIQSAYHDAAYLLLENTLRLKLYKLDCTIAQHAELEKHDPAARRSSSHSPHRLRGWRLIRGKSHGLQHLFAGPPRVMSDRRPMASVAGPLPGSTGPVSQGVHAPTHSVTELEGGPSGYFRRLSLTLRTTGSFSDQRYNIACSTAGTVCQRSQPHTAVELIELIRLVMGNIQAMLRQSFAEDPTHSQCLFETLDARTPTEESAYFSPGSANAQRDRFSIHRHRPWRIVGSEAVVAARYMFEMYKYTFLTQLFPHWAAQLDSNDLVDQPRPSLTSILSRDKIPPALLRMYMTYLVDDSVPITIDATESPAMSPNDAERRPSQAPQSTLPTEAAPAPISNPSTENAPLIFPEVNTCLLGTLEDVEMRCAMLHQALLLPIDTSEHLDIVQGAVGTIRNWLFGQLGSVPMFLSYVDPASCLPTGDESKPNNTRARAATVGHGPRPDNFYSPTQGPSSQNASKTSFALPMPQAAEDAFPQSSSDNDRDPLPVPGSPTNSGDHPQWWHQVLPRFIDQFVLMLSEPLKGLFSLGDVIPATKVAICQSILDLIKSLATEQPVPMTDSNWQLLLANLVGVYETLPMHHAYSLNPTVYGQSALWAGLPVTSRFYSNAADQRPSLGPKPSKPPTCSSGLARSELGRKDPTASVMTLLSDNRSLASSRLTQMPDQESIKSQPSGPPNDPSLVVEGMVGQLVETIFICLLASRCQNPAMWRRVTNALSRNPNWPSLVCQWEYLISQIAYICSQQVFTHLPVLATGNYPGEGQLAVYSSPGEADMVPNTPILASPGSSTESDPPTLQDIITESVQHKRKRSMSLHSALPSYQGLSLRPDATPDSGPMELRRPFSPRRQSIHESLPPTPQGIGHRASTPPWPDVCTQLGRSALPRTNSVPKPYAALHNAPRPPSSHRKRAEASRRKLSDSEAFATGRGPTQETRHRVPKYIKRQLHLASQLVTGGGTGGVESSKSQKTDAKDLEADATKYSNFPHQYTGSARQREVLWTTMVCAPPRAHISLSVLGSIVAEVDSLLDGPQGWNEHSYARRLALHSDRLLDPSDKMIETVPKPLRFCGLDNPSPHLNTEVQGPSCLDHLINSINWFTPEAVVMWSQIVRVIGHPLHVHHPTLVLQAILGIGRVCDTFSFVGGLLHSRVQCIRQTLETTQGQSPATLYLACPVRPVDYSLLDQFIVWYSPWCLAPYLYEVCLKQDTMAPVVIPDARHQPSTSGMLNARTCALATICRLMCRIQPCPVPKEYMAYFYFILARAFRDHDGPLTSILLCNCYALFSVSNPYLELLVVPLVLYMRPMLQYDSTLSEHARAYALRTTFIVTSYLSSSSSTRYPLLRFESNADAGPTGQGTLVPQEYMDAEALLETIWNDILIPVMIDAPNWPTHLDTAIATCCELVHGINTLLCHEVTTPGDSVGRKYRKLLLISLSGMLENPLCELVRLTLSTLRTLVNTTEFYTTFPTTAWQTILHAILWSLHVHMDLFMPGPSQERAQLVADIIECLVDWVVHAPDEVMRVQNFSSLMFDTLMRVATIQQESIIVPRREKTYCSSYNRLKSSVEQTRRSVWLEQRERPTLHLFAPSTRRSSGTSDRPAPTGTEILESFRLLQDVAQAAIGRLLNFPDQCLYHGQPWYLQTTISEPALTDPNADISEYAFFSVNGHTIITLHRSQSYETNPVFMVRNPVGKYQTFYDVYQHHTSSALKLDREASKPVAKANAIADPGRCDLGAHTTLPCCAPTSCENDPDKPPDDLPSSQWPQVANNVFFDAPDQLPIAQEIDRFSQAEQHMFTNAPFTADEEQFFSPTANTSSLSDPPLLHLPRRNQSQPNNAERYEFPKGSIAANANRQGNEMRGWVLLETSKQLMRDLRLLDGMNPRICIKLAVFYVGNQQVDEASILGNRRGSRAYEGFLQSLGWEIDLTTHQGYRGQLQANGSDGKTAIYFGTPMVEVVFHDVTRMPIDANDHRFVRRKRHVGNDHVHIVWNENNMDYIPGTISGDFGNAQIVVNPLNTGMCGVRIYKDDKVPSFGPLMDGMIITQRAIGTLVRATAVHAHTQIQRSRLPQVVHPYTQRCQEIREITKRHAIRPESTHKNQQQPGPTALALHSTYIIGLLS